MLTGKQKRYLRSTAHHLTPIVQIGKGAISENLVQQVNEVLEKRELIKVSILQNCEEDKHEISQTLARLTKAELVQLIGLTIVLYKRSSQEKYRKIELP